MNTTPSLLEIIQVGTNVSPETINAFTRAALAIKPMLHVYEAAMYMGCKRSHIDELCEKRRIPYYKPNGKIRYFKTEDLNSYMQENRIEKIAQ